MPKIYGDFIKNAVSKNAFVKRIDVRNFMIKEMGFDGKQLPADFPSVDQIKRRVTGLRYSQKKATTN